MSITWVGMERNYEIIDVGNGCRCCVIIGRVVVCRIGGSIPFSYTRTKSISIVEDVKLGGIAPPRAPPIATFSKRKMRIIEVRVCRII